MYNLTDEEKQMLEKINETTAKEIGIRFFVVNTFNELFTLYILNPTSLSYTSKITKLPFVKPSTPSKSSK